MTLVQRGLATLETGRHVTPALFVDPAEISGNLKLLQDALPGFDLHYAMKCNSGLGVLNAVHDAGVGFEIASAAELELLIRNGLHCDNVIFSAPVKRPADIAAAASAGVRWFSAASEHEITKILDVAPSSAVMIRVAVPNDTAHWDLSRTWGASSSAAVGLAKSAEALGASAVGLAFHTGSQNECVQAWARALAIVSDIMDQSTVTFDLVNIGGGFPSTGASAADHAFWKEAGRSIEAAVAALPYVPTQLVAEPGRSAVASAAVLFTTVLDVQHREDRRWVHVDAGAFNGLYEHSPMGGSLPFTITAFGRDIQVLEEAVLAGGSCDGDDIVSTAVQLPVDLEPGEVLAVPNAGAYTGAYSAQLCGLPAPVIINQVTHLDAAPALQYEVVLPGDEAFDRICTLEERCFAAAGFLDEDGTLASIRKLDHMSRLIVVPSVDDPLGIGRVLDASPAGFLTLTEMEIYPEIWKRLPHMDLDSAAECLTVAPFDRNPAAAVHLFRAIFHDFIERDKTIMLSSIDEELLHKMNSRYGDAVFEWLRLGPSVDYVGSPTVPVLGDLYEAQRTVKLMEQFDIGAMALPLVPIAERETNQQLAGH